MKPKNARKKKTEMKMKMKNKIRKMKNGRNTKNAK